MERSCSLPDLGEGIHEGEVLAILVSVGDEVKEGEPILEIETDKAAVEIPSPFTGKILAIHVIPGDVVKVGEPLITFDHTGNKQVVSNEKPGGKITRGVDTGPVMEKRKGLVTAEDVTAFAEKKEEAAPPPAKETPPPGVRESTLPDFSIWGPVERVPVRSIRRATARHMTFSWSQIPHVTNHNTADVTELEYFRQEYKKDIEDSGGRLTLTVFAMKALVTALKAYPRFNSSLDPARGEIVLKKYYHIGVAVDTVDGLIVPVIRDVDRKSIVELAIELDELVQRTRARENTLEESRGGTFTITNVGGMDSGHFVPIINSPQVGILGMGSARMEPVVMEKERGGLKIVPRLMMPLILTIDHRVLDGADAMRFMKVIKNGLEDPERLFITMS